MVDEYQDSNRLQDSIFFAISREGKNVFLVGDVKQSIYRFRLADPTIFLEKYRAWPNCAEALPGSPAAFCSPRISAPGRRSWTRRMTFAATP